MIPIFLKNSFLILLLYVVFSIAVTAASVVSVDRISFDKVGREEWLRCRVQVSSSGNPSETARDSRFLDDVQARIYLSFRDSRKGFSFYSAKLEIITLEQGEKYYLDFFLPGAVAKRDRLSTTPFAYLVEFSVGEFVIPFEQEFASTNMNSESAREMFKNKAEEVEGEMNGILLPSFLAPFYLTFEDEEQYPAFRRTDTKY